jgi:hypothetical protein
MPDFLTRLIERSFGTTETVQPIITPIFAKEKQDADNFSQENYLIRNTNEIEKKAEIIQSPESERSRLSNEDNNSVNPLSPPLEKGGTGDLINIIRCKIISLQKKQIKL